MDLVIRNAMIIDGTGRARYAGDVGINDGLISAVGTVIDQDCEVIDAEGAVVAPGFIDVHTHYDAQAFWDPMLSPSVFHGVTTVLAGNCGFTLAPLSGDPEDADYLLRMLSRVEGMPLSTLREAIKPDWKSFGEYLDKLDGKLAINTAFMVGHSTLRRTVMGERAVTNKSTPAELEAMCALLRKSLEEGGVGFSTTISATHSDYEGNPVPSRVASREEMLTLAGVIAEYPGTWLEMVFGVPIFGEEEYKLAADLSLAAERPLNWNALQINTNNLNGMESRLRTSDYATERGATVYGLIPATPMSTLLNFVNMFVLDTLPGWSTLVPLSPAERLKALADPKIRSMLKTGAREESEKPLPRITGWSAFRLEGLSSEQNAQWNGKPLGDYAEAIGKDSLDALFDLAIEENLAVSFSRLSETSDEKSWAIRGQRWQDPRCIIGGSDAGAHLDMLNSFAFSTQLLGEGIRRRKLLSLEDGVYRITGLPAERFGLTGRGKIAVGSAADLVIFDPETVDCGPIAMRGDLPGGERRLYADSIGIHHVIVGGVPVAADNRPTGKMGGKVLRSGKDTHTVSLNAKRVA